MPQFEHICLCIPHHRSSMRKNYNKMNYQDLLDYTERFMATTQDECVAIVDQFVTERGYERVTHEASIMYFILMHNAGYDIQVSNITKYDELLTLLQTPSSLLQQKPSFTRHESAIIVATQIERKVIDDQRAARRIRSVSPARRRVKSPRRFRNTNKKPE